MERRTSYQYMLGGKLRGATEVFLAQRTFLSPRKRAARRTRRTLKNIVASQIVGQGRAGAERAKSCADIEIDPFETM